MVTTQNVQGEIHSLDARIDRMHRRDRLGALAFVAALWITVLFVLGSVWALVTVRSSAPFPSSPAAWC